MCGIAGAYGSDPTGEERGVVREIVIGQRHRGPDHQGMEHIPGKRAHVTLGHNRLSIIDLSSQANQPMWDADHRYCLVFNGEIYNYIELKAELAPLGHRFRTRSDSEVIIEAFKEWGIDAVQRFNGMFAFALFDSTEEKLWLVRDRFGVKPLYYYCSGTALYFASTCRVLADHFGLEPSLEYAARGLKYWVYEDDSDISPYTGLKSLRLAHYLEVETGAGGRIDTVLRRYYDFEARIITLREDLASQSIESLTGRVDEMLQQSIEVRLRSDVPVGISLSGGLDSSTIAAVLSRKHSDVTGFTFGSPNDRSSEGPLVEELRRQAGIRVEYVWPKAREIAGELRSVLEAQESPFPAGSIVAQYSVYKAARARGIKVLLGGQGGDELFMGYRKFQLFRMRHLIHRRRYGEALGFAINLLPTAAAELPEAARYWAHRRRYFGNDRSEGALNLPSPSPIRLNYDPAQPLWLRQMRDVLCYSLPTLLRYEDRNSMGNSVESRLPFMDYRLMEMAVALPDAVKVRKGYGKWILRQVVKGSVPEAIRSARYKLGFNTNQAAWIHNGLGAFIRSELHSRLPVIRQWLMPGSTIDGTFSDEQLAGSPTPLAAAVTLIWLGDRSRVGR